MIMEKHDKSHIPLRYYYKFILLSIIFITCIFIIKSGYFNLNVKNSNYELPFIQVVNEEKLVRIYPGLNSATIVQGNILNFDTLVSLIGKPINYQDFSKYDFGRIDHHIDKGKYTIFDKSGSNIITIYAGEKVCGFTYRYLDTKSLIRNEGINQEYLSREISKIQKFIGQGFITKSEEGVKDFISHNDKYVYVFTINADNISGSTLADIVSSNKNFSLDISVFNDLYSYQKTK